jgi:hypothetical protein
MDVAEKPTLDVEVRETLREISEERREGGRRRGERREEERGKKKEREGEERGKEKEREARHTLAVFPVPKVIIPKARPAVKE